MMENVTDFHKTVLQLTTKKYASAVLQDTLYKTQFVSELYPTVKLIFRMESAADVWLGIIWLLMELAPHYQKDVHKYLAVKVVHLALLAIFFRVEFVTRSTQTVSCIINQQNNVVNVLLITS